VEKAIFNDQFGSTVERAGNEPFGVRVDLGEGVLLECGADEWESPGVDPGLLAVIVM